MKIVDRSNKISKTELGKMAEKTFGDLVKAVVDVERKVMAVDAELHADQEQFLLENNSEQKNLWGINLYPGEAGDDWIEFDSMINLRPSWGNRSRGVNDLETQKKIIKIVNSLIK